MEVLCKCRELRSRGFNGEAGEMSVPPVSSNVHGQLDAQIAQLTQCKPLPEHEVRLVSFGFGFGFVRLSVESCRLLGLYKGDIQRWQWLLLLSFRKRW